jgi:Ca-activated chloride channel homolog
MNPLAPWRFRLLGYDAAIEQPVYLGLVLLGLALGVLGVVLAFRRRSAAASVLSERFLEVLAPGLSVLRPALQSVFYALGLSLFAVALAQPQCGTHKELTKRSGIDLVVALDASNSMSARDVQPSRMERARLELLTLLDELKGDRVGIVAFAGSAFVQCPLTTDYDAARLFLRAIDPAEMPQGGTDIGGALELSLQLLQNADRGTSDRVVVLVSDGEDFGGDVEAAAHKLKEAGVKVLAVGIGSEAGEPIPLFNRRGEQVGYKRDASGATVLTRLDRAGLARLAELTGGELFYQPRGVAMSEVVARIDRLQKSEFESRLMVHYDQHFQYYALPGLLLLVVGMLIRPSRRRPT